MATTVTAAQVREDTAPGRSRKSTKSPPEFFLVLWGLALTGIVLAHAQRRLWYDEIYSYYMGLLPDLRTVLSALAGGGDLNPILFQLATRASLWTLGPSAGAARVPALVGFLVMSLCLYRVVRRRLGWQYGLVAMAIPAVTGAFRYAWEARPYGMVMGFSGLALVCWQEATSRTRRAWWLAGLTSAIACALFSHAWAILLFVPFGAGEIARAYRRRRADWTLWCCLAVAATSMAGVLPLLRLARSVTFGAALFQPSWRYVPNTYEMLLAPALWPMLGGMVLAAFWLARQAHMRPVAVENGLAEHEYIAAIGFLAIPAVAVMVAGVMHTAFMNRYGVLGVMGIALTGTSLAHRLTNGDRRFGLRLACWMMLAMAGQFGYWLYELMASDPPPAEQSGLIHAAKLPPIHEVSPELPFVSSSALQFLELDLYSPDSLKSRMFYLMDPEAAMRITQSNVYEAALPNVVRLFPVKAKLARYQEFTKQHPKFLVYGPYFHSLDWLMQKLIEDRAHLRLIGVYRGAYGDNLLLEVTVR